MGNLAPWAAVVDDDASACAAVVDLLRSYDLEARGFPSSRHFLSASRGAMPACLILDVNMPEVDGFALQRELARDRVDVPIVFVTGDANVPSSVRAMKAGAIDYLMKPYDENALLACVREGYRRTILQHGAPLVAPRRGAFAETIGSSGSLRTVLRQIEQVAVTDSTVLVEGETGTGKELVARSIHELSARSKGPFVKVNCAAIPAALIESELMGHERGAFTGALARRIGRFEQANGGTIFLDEIGDMPLELQPKLLRILQERELERLGSQEPTKVDVRVVAATNRDLEAMATQRTFREDLYFRLCVFPIFLPPLRDRKEDIPLLSEHFLRELGARSSRGGTRRLSANDLAELMAHSWPGNIRELRNVLERAVILAGDGPLAIRLDPGHRSNATPSEASSGGGTDTLAEHSRAHILKVLEATNWVVSGPNGAAARLQLPRSTLSFRMKKLGIERGR